VVLALVLYRPWTDLPFDIWDFREFLPVLKAQDGVMAQFHALREYYAPHGRMNLLFYGSFVVQWQWFGLDPAGWQWWRFVLMTVALVLAYRLIRRFRFSPPAAAAGAALFIASSSVQRGWVQLLAEPQVLCLLLVAALLATRYQEARHWLPRAVAIAGLVLGVLLSKEVVGVLALPILLVALVDWRRGELARPLLSRRNVGLSLFLAAAVLAIGAALMAVRQEPAAQGYAMAYGSAPLSFGTLATSLGRVLLPHQVAEHLLLGLIYPANVAFIILLALGWYHRLARPVGSRWTELQRLAAMLLVPVCGALVYWPWPKWDSFYGLPFLFGSALLVAAAVEELGRRGGGHRWLAGAAVLVLVGYSGIAADRSVRAATAMLRVNADLAGALADLGPAGRVVIVGQTEGPRALPVRGFELKAYAAAVDLAPLDALPAVLEAACEAIPSLLAGRAGQVMVVSYSYGCGRLPGAGTSWQRSFTYRDWLTLGRRTGTIAADLVVVSAPP